MFVSPVLKEKYIYTVDGCLLGIGRRLDSWTKLEMRKIEPSERPDWYQEALDSGKGMHNYFDKLAQLKLPDTWTYYDDEIPGWYQHMEKKAKAAIPY